MNYSMVIRKMAYLGLGFALFTAWSAVSSEAGLGRPVKIFNASKGSLSIIIRLTNKKTNAARLTDAYVLERGEYVAFPLNLLRDSAELFYSISSETVQKAAINSLRNPGEVFSSSYALSALKSNYQITQDPDGSYKISSPLLV